MARPRLPFALSLAAAAAIGICLLAAELAGYGVERLSGDIASTADVHPWTGAFSTLGLLGWAACCAMCAVAGAALRGRGDPRSGFFLATAALLAFLTLDDAYLIHEFAVDQELGIPQTVVFAGIAIAALLVARRYWWAVVDTHVAVLVLAIGALAWSVALDIPEPHVSFAGFEEWMKLSGIAALCVWCSTAAVRALNDMPPGRGSVAAPGDGSAEASKLELSP